MKITKTIANKIHSMSQHSRIANDLRTQIEFYIAKQLNCDIDELDDIGICDTLNHACIPPYTPDEIIQMLEDV